MVQEHVHKNCWLSWNSYKMKLMVELPNLSHEVDIGLLISERKSIRSGLWSIRIVCMMCCPSMSEIKSGCSCFERLHSKVEKSAITERGEETGGDVILFKYCDTERIFRQSILEDIHSVALGCPHEDSCVKNEKSWEVREKLKPRKVTEMVVHSIPRSTIGKQLWQSILAPEVHFQKSWTITVSSLSDKNPKNVLVPTSQIWILCSSFKSL